jgi:hypothetical protein
LPFGIFEISYQHVNPENIINSDLALKTSYNFSVKFQVKFVICTLIIEKSYCAVTHDYDDDDPGVQSI